MAVLSRSERSGFREKPMKVYTKPQESSKRLALIVFATFIILTVALFGAVKIFGGSAKPMPNHAVPAVTHAKAKLVPTGPTA